MTIIAITLSRIKIFFTINSVSRSKLGLTLGSQLNPTKGVSGVMPVAGLSVSTILTEWLVVAERLKGRNQPPI